MAVRYKKKKQNYVVTLILGIVILCFTILAIINSVNSGYTKATITEIKRTYDKKRNGSKRKYYEDVVVSFEYNGQTVSGPTTIKKSSQSSLPKVGDTIDIEITKNEQIMAYSPMDNIRMGIIGVALGAFLIWTGVMGIKKSREKAGELPESN